MVHFYVISDQTSLCFEASIGSRGSPQPIIQHLMLKYLMLGCAKLDMSLSDGVPMTIST